MLARTGTLVGRECGQNIRCKSFLDGQLIGRAVDTIDLESVSRGTLLD
jgi:hypothetical protein